MRTDVRNGASPSLTSLVSGILSDVEQLIVQQGQLLRLEIREDLRKARTGAIFLGVGLGVALIGLLLLCVMVPLLLWWAVPELPLWAWFAITGTVFLLVGGGAVYSALKYFQAAATLPESVATVKENVQCLLRPTQSSSR